VFKTVCAGIAGLSLLACLAAPAAFFQGWLAEAAFENLFAAASLGWFVAATVYVSRK